MRTLHVCKIVELMKRAALLFIRNQYIVQRKLKVDLCLIIYFIYEIFRSIDLLQIAEYIIDMYSNYTARIMLQKLQGMQQSCSVAIAELAMIDRRNRTKQVVCFEEQIEDERNYIGKNRVTLSLSISTRTDTCLKNWYCTSTTMPRDHKSNLMNGKIICKPKERMRVKGAKLLYAM